MNKKVKEFLSYVSIRRKLSNYIKKHLTGKSSIEKNAIALESMTEFNTTFLDNLKAIPLIARLSDSDPPIVKIISSGFALIASATLWRAKSNAFFDSFNSI